MRRPAFSFEALFGVLVGLLVGLVEMNWELRSLGVIFTTGLAVHLARRLEHGISAKIAFATVPIGLLVLGTYHPIWMSFHEDFPTVTEDAALSRIVEFCTLVICAFAAYVLLIRPQGKESYRVLPAQLIAFGAIVMAAGLISVAIGLAWQFKQNWSSGVSPTGAPVPLPREFRTPQIPQSSSAAALPPPERNASQFFSGYDLTPTGIHALADELYKLKESINSRINLQRTSSERSSTSMMSNIYTACERAGINCVISDGRPNSPDESGLMIYVADPNNPTDSAKAIQTVLERLGVHVPFIARSGIGPNDFILFVGPAP
jgi:hypothetical protein